MKVPLECPEASYGEGMRVQCRKLGGLCVHQYFKRCKGWWALTDTAGRCPVRKEKNHEQK